MTIHSRKVLYGDELIGLPGTEPTGYVFNLTLILFGTKEDPLARNQHIVTRRKEIGKVDTKQRKQGTLHSEMLFVCNHIFDYFYVFGIAALPETKCCQPVSSLQIQAFSILYFFIECSQALTPFATIIIT